MGWNQATLYLVCRVVAIYADIFTWYRRCLLWGDTGLISGTSVRWSLSFSVAPVTGGRFSVALVTGGRTLL